MTILPSDASYKTFCDLFTGYRLFTVIMEAVDSGLIDSVGQEGCSIDHLLDATGFKAEEGRRFVVLLVNAGILEECGDRLCLSRFARTYLRKEGELSQRGVLEFEKLLVDKWRSLRTILREGQGTLIVDQPPGEYRRRLRLFQKAMGEAALVRANELWDAIAELPDTGLIVDVGAGDCSYLTEFLRRHSRWHAVACDLPDVFAVAGEVAKARMDIHACNIIDARERNELVSRYRGSASLLLMSNFIHCYSEPENVAIIGQLGDLLKEDGALVIHDFFRDGNGFGALYDIHMMINTYSGRTFTFDESERILREAGFTRSSTVELPSFSHGIVARRRVLRHKGAD